MRADGREHLKTGPDGLPRNECGLVLIRFGGQRQDDVSRGRLKFPFDSCARIRRISNVGVRLATGRDEERRSSMDTVRFGVRQDVGLRIPPPLTGHAATR